MNIEIKPILFLLAHAGGSAAVYQHLFCDIQKYFNIIPLELPGHGQRINEKPLTSLKEMNFDLESQVKRHCPKPQICFILGHSLGAQNAFLLGHALAGLGFLETQCHLFLSSSYILGKHSIDPNLLDLPINEFWKQTTKFFKYKILSAIEDEALISLFAPTLHADLTAILNYVRNNEGEDKLIIDWSITAIHAKDETMKASDVKLWKNCTKNSFKFEQVSGDHFHLLENPAPIMEILLRTLSQKKMQGSF